jgi:N-acetylmuramoyl-L-alanine amidase
VTAANSRERHAGRRLLAADAAVLVAAAVADAAPARPGKIERVRYEADGSSTRVIIMLSRPVPFEVRVLGGEASRKTERRVVLDFSNATLGPGAAEPIGVENGLLQQIRTGQFTARTARVVLDLASVTKHTVDAYEDPPRVVIDIAGKPTATGPVIAEPVKREAPRVPEARTADSVAKPVEGPRSAEVASAPRPEPPRAAPPPAPAPVPAPKTESPRAEPPPAEPAKRSQAQSQAKATTPNEPAPGKPNNRPWRIVLDPGHGGADPGAQGVDGLLEKDVVLAIAQRLKRRLEESSNAKVLLTRETDTTRTLAERTAFANANSADLFISIHANADRSGELQGIETYTLNNSNDRATIRLAKMENGPAVRVGRGDLSFILSDMVQSGKEEESNALAERLHSRVLARLRSRYTDVHNLGVKKGPFYVLVGAYMPCVLIETSFLSHPVEGKRLGSTAYQHDIAEGLYLGITDFLSDARLAKTL